MLRATHDARCDNDGDPSTSQESELSTEDGDESEDDDEGNDEFESEESDDVADHDDGKKVMMLLIMMMRQEHAVMGVMMMRRSCQLKLFFLLDQDLGLGGQSVLTGDLFNDKIKFKLNAKPLNGLPWLNRLAFISSVIDIIYI